VTRYNLFKSRLIGGFFIHYILVIGSLVVLSGCATNRGQESPLSAFYEAYQALSAKQSLLRSEAAQLPYAVMQVSLNQNHNILMPLGHMSGNELKWYSQDRFGFTTNSGRVTQVYNVQSELSSIKTNALWKRFELPSFALNQRVKLPIELDFLSLNRFAVKGTLTIEGVAFEERVLWGFPVQLLRIEEQVQIPSMNYDYTNIYWKDTKTNFIWESIQKWGPNVPEIHYQVVKPWRQVAYP
jgi:hypothetical protein